MNNETIKVKVWRIGGTDKAYLCAKLPKERDLILKMQYGYQGRK
jgi:hypothetical protein